MSINGGHPYGGTQIGRGQRHQSKFQGVRLVTIERLEELLGKNPKVTEPPPPVYRRGKTFGKRIAGERSVR
jgi:hypothetical protein